MLYLCLDILLASLGFGGYWLYSSVIKPRRAAKAEEARLEKPAEIEYNKTIAAQKPNFAFLSYTHYNLKDGLSNPRLDDYYVFFYDDKISLITEDEPIIEFNLPINLITMYYLTDNDTQLRLYFRAANSKSADDSCIDFSIRGYDKRDNKIKEYASKQIGFPEYLSENFKKVPKKTISL